MRLPLLKPMHAKRYRFSTKLLISYLLLCLVPALLITTVFYNKAKEQISETSAQFIELFANQLATSVDIYISQVNNASLTIYTDYELINYLGRETTYSSSERIRLNLLLQRQLSALMTQLPHLQGVAILSESGLVYTSGYLPDVASQQPFWNEWFEHIRKANGQLVIVPAHSQLYHPSGTTATVFSAGRLIQDIEGRPSGILLFQLSPQPFIAHTEKMNGPRFPFHKRVVIETPQQKLIYDSEVDAASFMPDSSSPALQDPRWMTGVGNAGKLLMKVAVPIEDLDKQIRSYRNLALLIAATTAGVLALFSMLLSYQISKPINRLIRNMKHVENGRYLPISETGMNLELEALTRTYNLMIKKIKHLIEDIYLAQIKQNEARFLALQNQINPHWLYNTLESIRMQAYLSKAPDVAAMIKTLGRLFHLALSQREQTNRIADEIEYIQAYMQLQNVRFEDRFRLVVKLSEALLQAPIIKLTLQPLIENCIIHGFTDPDLAYEIRIEGDASGDVGLLRIADNGDGIPPARLAELQRQLDHMDRLDTGEAGSLGLRNIQQRLQLHYGYAYGLQLESTPGMGCVVHIRFPLGKGEDAHVQSDAG